MRDDEWIEDETVNRVDERELEESVWWLASRIRREDENRIYRQKNIWNNKLSNRKWKGKENRRIGNRSRIETEGMEEIEGGMGGKVGGGRGEARQTQGLGWSLEGVH